MPVRVPCARRRAEERRRPGGAHSASLDSCARISVPRASAFSPFPLKRLTPTGWRRRGPSAEPAWEVLAQRAPPLRASRTASQFALPLAAKILLSSTVSQCRTFLQRLTLTVRVVRGDYCPVLFILSLGCLFSSLTFSRVLFSNFHVFPWTSAPGSPYTVSVQFRTSLGAGFQYRVKGLFSE